MTYFLILLSFFTIQTAQAPTMPTGHLPINEDKQFYEKEVITTAYTLSPDETDNSPCVSASGRNLCLYPDNSVAYNLAPYGTAVEINGKIYQVWDRVSQKYNERVDILMQDKQTALEFGKQKIKIKVYE